MRSRTAGLIIAGALAIAGARPALPQPAPPLGGIHHTAWTGRDLPVGDVAGLERTPDGYLWFGSGAGLVRFDGQRFTVIDSVTAPALWSPQLGLTRPLMVDRDGKLWIVRADGALITYLSGRFDLAAPANGDFRPTYAVQDSSGRVWFLGGQSLFWVDGGRIVPAPLPPGVPDSGILGAVADRDRGLWIGTRSGDLWQVRDGRGIERSPPGTRGSTIKPLLMTRSGALWVAQGVIRVLDGGRWRIAASPVARVAAGDWSEGPDGSVWIASTGIGLLRWRDLDHFERIGQGVPFSGNVVTRVLHDREGLVWLATDAGIDRLRPVAFSTLGAPEGLPFAIPHFVLATADSAVWAVDVATLATWRLDGGLVRDRAGPIIARRMPGREIPFATTLSSGVWRFQLHGDHIGRLEDGRLRAVIRSPSLMSGAPPRAAAAPDGSLWVTTEVAPLGVVRDSRYRRLPVTDSSVFAAIAAGPDGTIWASGSTSPLLTMIRGDSVAARFGQDAGLSAKMVRLLPLGADTVWGLTAEGSLIRFAAGRFSTVTVPDVASALVAGSPVLLPSRTHLWFGSQGGIGRIAWDAIAAAADGRTGPPPVQWFGEDDGLRSPRTPPNNRNPGAVGADGRLWFSTPAGLAVVDPERVPANPTPPVLHVEQLLTRHEAGPMRASASTSIAPNPERIEIQFAAGSLRDPERVRLEYQLEGVDAGWTPGGPQWSAQYTRLRPGRYHFRVRGWNEDGVPAAAEAVLAFRVLPAWYQTWWFLGLALLAVAGAGSAAVAAAVRRRHRVTTLQIRERYEGILAERARMARELHDTLLQGFTGIAMRLHAIHARQQQGAGDTLPPLTGVLDLADKTLTEARQAIWDLRAPMFERGDLPAGVKAAIEQVLTGQSLEFAVRGAPRDITPEAEMTVIRVAREAASNVVRHAQARVLTATLEYGPRGVTLLVTDDGIGVDPDQAAAAGNRGHWGLAGMRERAERIGGSLQLCGAPGGGATVTLVLPAAVLA